MRQLGFCRAILGAIITALLVGTGFLFILFGLVPAVAVTLALFLPALLPFVLVGLGILFTEDLEDHLGHIRHEWKEVPDLVHPKG